MLEYHSSFNNKNYKLNSDSSNLNSAHFFNKSTTSIKGRRFIDEYNRTLIFKGVAVSGCSKFPIETEGSHVKDDSTKSISFVGRPFPLSEANEHLTRLSNSGLTCLRILVTWEAIEPIAPGELDLEFIQYMKELFVLLEQFGMVGFIDVHQDVWSRQTGGSGAPEWTLNLAGFNVEQFKSTAASHTHHSNLLPNDPSAQAWPSNCRLLS